MMKAMAPTKVLSSYNSCKGERGNWESMWQEEYDFILPRKNDVQKTVTPGEKKTTGLLDSTARMSNELLAGALHGMLTNPSGYFFGLTTGKVDLDNNDNVRLWVQSSVRKMHEILGNSNFHTEAHEMYLDLGCIGMSPVLMEEDEDDVVRFKTLPIREVYCKEDSKGKITTIYRCSEMEPADLIEDFGKENLPAKVLEDFKNGKTTKWEVVHAIYHKKTMPEKERKAYGRFKYVSQYILVKDKVNLSVKGFYEMPILTPRWSKVAGETYGRGPGENALPEEKVLNKMTETTLRGAQKVVDPPLQAPDDGFVMPIITRPAGINFYRPGSQDRIEPIFNDARIDFGYQAMDRQIAKVREAFYTDQLKLREGPEMTATEVTERVEQALRFLGPMLGRMQREFLQPMVERLFGIMQRRGMLDEVPAELTGVKLTVQYTSVIAMQQRSSELQSIRRTFQDVAVMATADPTVLDNFNGDRGSRYVARLHNFPQEILNSQDEIKAIRDARAKAQQQLREQGMENMQADNASKIVGAASKFQKAG